VAETHSLAFVDSIAAAPTIRLDLHAGTRGPFNMHDGTRFDPPPLKRSIPSSLLADGGVPTSAAYDNRTVVLKLQPMVNGKFMAADAAAAQMQLLYRELGPPVELPAVSGGHVGAGVLPHLPVGSGRRRLQPDQQRGHGHAAGRAVRLRPGGNPVGAPRC
jgi:hypothetical protein